MYLFMPGNGENQGNVCAYEVGRVNNLLYLFTAWLHSAVFAEHLL